MAAALRTSVGVLPLRSGSQQPRRSGSLMHRSVPVKPNTIQQRPSRRQQASHHSAVVAAAAADRPSIQLATARLPADVNRGAFVQQIYQWAATLTTNGRNLPFALPLRTDPSPDGFQISLLRVAKGGAVLSVADLVASVEEVAGMGDVLMVRLFEGEAAAELGLVGPNGGAQQPQQRLKILLEACVDIPLIMQTMPDAIRRAVVVSR